MRFILCLFFIGCTAGHQYSPDQSGSQTAGSRQEAIALLPEEIRLRYEGWNLKMIKSCSVQDSFDPRALENPNSSQSFVDLKIFFAKTGNSLLLLSPGSKWPDSSTVWEVPEFAIFDKPQISQEKFESRMEIPVVRNGQRASVALEMKAENGICAVYVGGFKIDAFAFATRVPITSHYSVGKKTEIGKNLSLEPTTPVLRRGAIKVSDHFATKPGQAMLSPWMKRETPDDSALPNSDHLVREFLIKAFGASRSELDLYFPSSGLSINSTSVSFVNRSNGVPFGYSGMSLMGLEREFADLRSSGEHSIVTRWKIRPPTFRIPDPNDSTAVITNETVDSKPWLIDVTSKLTGSIDNGGTFEISTVAFFMAEFESKHMSGAQCLAKRIYFGRALREYDVTDSSIGLNWYDVANPCLSLSDNLLQELLDSKDIPTKDSSEALPLDANAELNAFDEFLTVLREARPSRKFYYGQFDEKFRELVELYFEDNYDKNISDLDLQGRIPVLAKANQNFQRLRQIFVVSDERLRQRFASGLKTFINLALTAAFINFDLDELDILSKIQTSAQKTNGPLEDSFKIYIQNLAGYLTDKPKNEKDEPPRSPWNLLKTHVSKLDLVMALPEDTNTHLNELLEASRRIQAESWAKGHVDSFINSSASYSNLILWKVNARAIDEFYQRENTKLGGLPTGSALERRKAFQSRFLNIDQAALLIRYLEKFSAIISFLPECSSHRDVISRLWCTDEAAMVNTLRGVLFPTTRDRLWELSHEFQKILPTLPADDLRVRVVRRFFSPIFQSCSADNFRVKVKNLMSFLVLYRRNPGEESARSDFNQRFENVLSNCSQ